MIAKIFNLGLAKKLSQGFWGPSATVVQAQLWAKPSPIPSHLFQVWSSLMFFWVSSHLRAIGLITSSSRALRRSATSFIGKRSLTHLTTMLLPIKWPYKWSQIGLPGKPLIINLKFKKKIARWQKLNNLKPFYVVNNFLYYFYKHFMLTLLNRLFLLSFEN